MNKLSKGVNALYQRNAGLCCRLFMEQIKDRIKDRKTNQTLIAEKLGITRKHLSSILNGHSRIYLEDAIELLRILEIEDDDLLSSLRR